jgi:hypothetical protein
MKMFNLVAVQQTLNMPSCAFTREEAEMLGVFYKKNLSPTAYARVDEMAEALNRLVQAAHAMTVTALRADQALTPADRKVFMSAKHEVLVGQLHLMRYMEAVTEWTTPRNKKRKKAGKRPTEKARAASQLRGKKLRRQAITAANALN